MKKTQWMLYTKRADFDQLAARFSISPVLVRIMINRGVAPDEIGTYLHGTLADLPDPGRMKDLDRAAEILLRKRSEGKPVRVIGDYDIDGICSTYILTVGFRTAGIRADYDIPDRIRDGYGLNVNLIRKAYDDGIDTIVTCDNGIAAVDEIRAAKELGMKTFRAVVLEPNDMNVPLGLEKTADRWGLRSLEDVKIIEGSKHPFIEVTTMLLPDEELESINKRLQDNK